MFMEASWMLFTCSLCGIVLTIGNAYSDLEFCIRKEESDTAIYSNQYCMPTKNDVSLSCPGNSRIVIVSVQFALKPTVNECTKRVLNFQDTFCCNVQRNDNLYAADCLQSAWNSEDKQHYNQFMNEALQKCSNKKTCVLTENMFINLQREIPNTRQFSSYFQIDHQCVTVPTTANVDICTLGSVSKKEILIQNKFKPRRQDNKNCTCHVNSEGNGKVIVRALDVRTANSGLILKFGNTIKDLSRSRQPLFGFKNIITEREVEITTLKESGNTEDSVWLYLSDSNGRDINIVCDGPQHTTSASPRKTSTQPMTTSPIPDRETPAVQEVVADQEDDFLEEYWPMIYLGAGSGITIVLVVCVVGSILICRYSMMKEKRKGQYGNPYRHSQVNYNRSGQYDTVLDDMQHIPGHMVASNQETLEWR